LQPESCRAGLFYDLQFLPLTRVRSSQAMWAELVDEMNEELADSMESAPAGVIRKMYANPKWVPFTHDGAGNHLGVDLDPDERGTLGQVIVFGRDEDRKRLVAPSFAAFVDGFVAQLERGNLVLRDGRLQFARLLDGTPIESDDGVHANDVFGDGLPRT
jgi:cell wall assembly regulator SMI1